MNYRIVTISHGYPNAWYYMPHLWLKSLQGVEPLIITGEGYEPWGGLASKPKYLYRAIKEGRISEEYIIYCDSWDLVFAQHPDKVMQKFKYFNADVVANTEKNCFPGTYQEDFDKIEAPTQWKYLNSGFIVAKTESWLKCLESMDLPNVGVDHYDPEKGCNVHPEDQSLTQKVFLDQPVNFKLDYYCELSQTLHDADMSIFDFSGERIKNTVTNSEPCVFHFNGNAKDKLEIRNPILKHLNLL